MADTATLAGDLLTEARALGPEVVELRRSIHRRPELGLDNPETQGRIVDALTPLDLDVRTGTGLSSVVATLEGSRPGPAILLRADTDALPMTEDTEWSDRSEIEGRAHVCGHDAHVAMLVGAARILAARRDELAGTVRFMFQPGEEGSAGAASMIDEGVLTDGLDEPVTAAFAIHVTPNIPVGLVSSRPGSLMASTDDFYVTIRGRGGHASTPHFANDPIPVAAEMITALQTFVTRRVNAFDPAVVTVGHLTAGTTVNVIPETARLEGTIRTVSEGTRLGVIDGVERVIRGIAAAHDCEVDVQIRAGYPVTVNDGGFVEFGSDVARSVLGEHAYFEMPFPIMGAEDFSYVLQRVPGAMFFVGVCPDDITNSLEAPSCHSNRMRLNEDGLPVGVALHAAIALRYLDGRSARAAAE
jgi:hippurate hydrolase